MLALIYVYLCAIIVFPRYPVSRTIWLCKDCRCQSLTVTFQNLCFCVKD